MNYQTWLTQQNSPATETKEEFFLDLQKKKRKKTSTIMKGLTKKEKKEKEKKDEKSVPEVVVDVNVPKE